MSESELNSESTGLTKERFLFGATLFFVTLFLTIAVLTFDPADPPNQWAWPPNADYRNTLGAAGAVLGGTMLSLFGVGAYYILVSLMVVDLRVFGVGRFFAPNRQYRAHAPSFVGWVLSLIGLTALVTVAAPHLSPGPVVGSGGRLGIVAATVLREYIAVTGTILVAIFFIASGLILCASDEIAVVVSKLRRLRLPRRRRDDERKRNEESDEESGPPVRTASRRSGRKKAPRAEEVVEEDAGDDEETEWEEVEEETPLRIRKPKKSPRRQIEEEIEESTEEADPEEYELPSIDLLRESESFDFESHEQHVRDKARILESTFADFGFTVRVVEIQTGPVISQFEIQLEAGLRLSRITGLSDDLAIALKVPSVRIVAPIPGKNTVGIEVPNADRQLVRLREVIEDTFATAETMRIPVFLGKDVSGAPLVVDLAKMPHLLIAGRTGTGKSVCLNSIIISILMSRRPDEVRMLMIDPKMVELSGYKRIPHLMHPVVTDMRKAEAILGWAVDKMEERYALLARVGVRNLESYNQLGEEEIHERLEAEGYVEEDAAEVPTHMPYVVIIADEMADLMMTAAKEVEAHIIRLAQKSRAVGIHLVLATQKPTVDVITGLIKSNLPARISFQVASRTDSRVVLDEMGADKLLGNGDMLFLSPQTSMLKRGQGTYLSDEEINKVIGSVATSEPHFVQELVQLQVSDPEAPGGLESQDRDDLYPNAVGVVVREGRGSVSLLQRALGIGYGRAARLIDYMAEDGIIGPYNGSQAREVLLTLADWEAMQTQDAAPVAAPPSPPVKRNRVVLVDPAEEEEEEVDEIEETAPWEEEDEYDEEEGDWEEEYDDEDEGEDGEEYEYEEEEEEEEGQEG